MENKKAPLSIRILFVMTEVIFWMSSLVALVFIVANVLVHTGFFKDDVQLKVQLPNSFNVEEEGRYFFEGHWNNVKLVESTSKIHFVNTPHTLTKIFAASALLAIGFLMWILWYVRKFMINVKSQQYFDIQNIKFLKYISFILIGFWVYQQIYLYVFYFSMAKHFRFDDVEITAEFTSKHDVLLTALILYTLAHIFTVGSKMKEEAQLTI